MKKQQKILFTTMACLAGGAVLFMVLSKVEPALLMVGLALLSVFFGLLTYVSVVAMRKQERQARNREIEELMNAEDDDVVIESKKKKRLHLDKYSYVMLSIIAMCVCIYMFIRSIISF